ncbi:hypothetical protein ASG60_20595 [Methylobacterium sp. Leaf469]|uniref:DUF4268 domain-containing protein n=1 Tax=Methylobacterium sp. Leaf469 TaxID=1736387 RepID=UPI0006F8DB9C|nr:DUF4268 domain-containing protein [Methylobacterium sp. Leaf469]KQT96082.1 hypothetical protein ASG60_20595 [Methylobacterium sp. Leaf469]
MFQVNRAENRIRRLEERRFSDLGLRERDHLQEWLAGLPDALGEELLIIQKEFDGFADTRERLDLLALDKDGQLVVIENKLDDSGRDVTWQALKYAAYCSSLTKAQIVDIYQSYLDRYEKGAKAVERICEFLGAEDLQEVQLNAGNGQRLMLVAANFRKEVTAAVLWLLSHNIRAQCFRVVPYSHGDELFLDLQQIVPTPEAADFMIGMATKETEEKTIQAVQKPRHLLRLAFWEQALEQLRSAGLSRFNSISPSQEHWLNAATGMSGVSFTLIFSKDEARVEVGITRSDAAENKWVFDQLLEQKEVLGEKFGAPLDWLRLHDKKACRIVCAQNFDGYDRENWPVMIGWMTEHMQYLQDTFSAPIAALNIRLRNGQGPAAGLRLAD